MEKLTIGFLIYPQMTPLDMIGPAQMLSALPNAEVLLIGRTMDPVSTDIGFPLHPTTTFADCPELTVLCVPGGFGQAALMEDNEVLDFLRTTAEQAKYVTSVCTGSLLLAAAGVLKDRRATCHWAMVDQLPAFGVETEHARVVRDGRFITGGGVTAGIDFGLTLVAELAGEETAKVIQLAHEYDPQPPFDAGVPEKAGDDITSKVIERFRRARPNPS